MLHHRAVTLPHLPPHALIDVKGNETVLVLDLHPRVRITRALSACSSSADAALLTAAPTFMALMSFLTESGTVSECA